MKNRTKLIFLMMSIAIIHVINCGPMEKKIEQDITNLIDRTNNSINSEKAAPTSTTSLTTNPTPTATITNNIPQGLYYPTTNESITFLAEQIRKSSLQIPTNQISAILQKIEAHPTYITLKNIIEHTLKGKAANPLKKSDLELMNQACDNINIIMNILPTEAQKTAYFQTKLDPYKENLNIAELVKNMEDMSLKELNEILFTATQKASSRQPFAITMDDFNPRIIQIKYNKKILSPAEKTQAFQSLLAHQSNNIDIPLLVLLTSGFSYNLLAQIIKNAQKIAGDNQLQTSHIRQAILDFKGGEKIIPFNTISPDDLYKTAIHEASHAIATMYNQLPFFVSTLTIEPRHQSSGCVIRSLSYPEISSEGYTKEQKLKIIIINLSGVVGEQIFDVYQPTGYSQAIITDQHKILNFLSLKPSGGYDIQNAINCARIIAEHQDAQQSNIETKINEIIADCYVKAYELIYKNKNIIETLAHAAVKKGTLHEDEIYAIVGIARPLHHFEFGPMTTSESEYMEQYRFPTSQK